MVCGAGPKARDQRLAGGPIALIKPFYPNPYLLWAAGMQRINRVWNGYYRDKIGRLRSELHEYPRLRRACFLMGALARWTL